MKWRINRNPRSVNGLFTELFAFVAILLAVSAADVSGNAQQDTVREISVDDPRPVAKAIEVLEARHGWAITYEDPRYVYQGDLLDVTDSVRRDLDRFGSSKPPRVLIPKEGPLYLRYSVSPQTRAPDNPAALIQQILDTHVATGYPGDFRLEQVGQTFHVIPYHVKNKDNQQVEQGSILDVPITIPDQERTVLKMLEEICAAVSQATQTKVVLGTVPTNLFLQSQTHGGAASETARAVLIRTLGGTHRKLSWRLLYGPDVQIYALNVHMVPEQSSDVVPPALTTVPLSPDGPARQPDPARRPVPPG